MEYKFGFRNIIPKSALNPLISSLKVLSYVKLLTSFGGVEISLAGLGIKLRGGIIDNPSPWKGDPTTYGEPYSTGDQLYYTGGIGFMLDRNTALDISGAYGTWNARQINYTYDSSGSNVVVGPTDNITTVTVNATFLYRF